ncbi:homoserine O-acetyltransferase [Bacillus tamaricis]|uniref:Homoserine O-acetyltransferase n=1 Tax=Evansella tamaricis TaxID=2069301 RepID=A0ABS6JBB7_9BACI|nr:homoserine O-acetyltransferase [Evansella tamaricis]
MGNTVTGKVTLPTVTLESGIQLKNVTLAYEKAGTKLGDPILICHALTGNQHAVGTEKEPGWWRGLIHHGGHIDLNKHQVITFNVLGGCNGSTGPTSPVSGEESGTPYRTDLPFISVRDMVNTQRLALELLGIKHLRAVVGGSLGGMQVLEWAILYPDFIDRIVVMAATSELSDYGMAYNAIARKAIVEDKNWNMGYYSETQFPSSGLAIARMIGMITYRSDRLFNQRFHREEKDPWGGFHKEVAYQVESYLLYQGEKFTKRFDPNSYLYLLKAMDHHDIAKGRGSLKDVLSRFKKKVELVAFEGDLLYPSDEVKRLGQLWREVGADVSFNEVETVFGHDGFLTEYEKWGNIVKAAVD